MRFLLPPCTDLTVGCALFGDILGIPVIDIHPVFSAHPAPLTLFAERTVVHYNARGYKLVADAILSRIQAGSHPDPHPGIE